LDAENRHKKQRKITPKQIRFIEEFLIDRNSTRAAKVAGYAHPHVMGAMLRNPAKYPLVVEEINRRSAELSKTAAMSAADLLRRIHAGIAFCPTDWFGEMKDGGYEITAERLEELPADIRSLVSEFKVKTVTTQGMSGPIKTTTLWVRLVSKEKLLDLAAKCQLGERFVGVQHNIDWGPLSPTAAADWAAMTQRDPDAPPLQHTFEALPPAFPPASNDVVIAPPVARPIAEPHPQPANDDAEERGAMLDRLERLKQRAGVRNTPPQRAASPLRPRICLNG
jgi:terminase small subunit-like protein